MSDGSLLKNNGVRSLLMFQAHKTDTNLQGLILPSILQFLSINKKSYAKKQSESSECVVINNSRIR